MSNRSDIVYCYDGSFKGLMCCVYESYLRKEKPFDIVDVNDCRATLFEVRDISTDEEKARRVSSAIREKISAEAYDFLYKAYLSCLEQKELHILSFIYLGFKAGKQTLKMLTNETVSVLYKAVNHLLNETGLLRGFVRFSDFGGGLVATIEPKNNVLPILKYHFLDRFPDGTFIIYDKTHSLVLLAQKGQNKIISVDDFQPPSAEADELKYRALWKRFYDTIAVEGRENPKCRMSHMPKRYWAHMTEMHPQHGRALLGENQKFLGDNKPVI